MTLRAFWLLLWHYLHYQPLRLDQKGVFTDTWCMSANLDTLERKVDQLLDLCRKLRAENATLRGRVVGLEGEKLILTEKMDTARSRLESIMERLPEQ
jgi:cell division protein ZapB